MNIHTLSPEEALASLRSSDQGLSEGEALKRLKEGGANQIEGVRKKSLLKLFIAQFTHFLAILLWIAVGLCLVSEYLNPRQGLLKLAIAIFGVIFINAIFTFIQEYKAEKTIEELKKLLPFIIKVMRDGIIKEIPSEEIVPGDILILREGDKVPADARLIESINLLINDALITGESTAKHKNHQKFEGEYLKSPNIVFAGSFVEKGIGKAVVFASAMSTELGKIAHLTKEVPETESSLQKEIKRLSKILAIIAMTIGVICFLLGFFIGTSFWQNFLFSVGIIIALVPEGLLPTVSLSLAISCYRMAQKKALIKKLLAVESLGSVTVICTDKTGTLTQNKMEVEKIWTFEKGKERNSFNNTSLTLNHDLFTKKTTALDLLFKIARFCNNAMHNGKYEGGATEIALLKATEENLKDIESKRIYEIPFDSERKRMSTINNIEGKIFLLTKGAVEIILPLCKSITSGNSIEKFNEEEKKAIIKEYREMMDEGYRVMAFAYKELDPKVENDYQKEVKPGLDIESNLTFAGLMAMRDAPRPEVPLAIKKCKEAGIKVIMITGDAGRTALSIAKKIGLCNGHPLVIENIELDNMSDEALINKFRSEELIFARMTPLHKIRIVSVLEGIGEKVAVTGDGVNDAPALKKAHIGIAMGSSGTDVAREAADIVLLDDNFASIVNAIEEGRSVFENIRKFITYILASNMAELFPYLFCVIFRVPIPLTVMQILSIDLVTDLFPALALGAEKPSQGIMKLPPRKAKERLLNYKILCRGYLFLGPLEAIAGLFGFFFVLKNGGWEWLSNIQPDKLLYLTATTACLAGINICQISNVFACRSSRESIFKLGFFSNKFILFGIACEILLACFVIYTPIGNAIFGTTPISLNLILLLIPFSIGLLLIEEVRKFIVRRMKTNY